MIPILYQDNHVVVCLKPAGMTSQSGEGLHLLSCLTEQLGGEYYPVHRLDRETGGLMVVARTRQAAAGLSESIQKQAFTKEYLCIVQGCPQPAEGELTDLLLHDKVRNKSFVVRRMRGGVKEARLSYLVLRQRGEQSLLRVRLYTGRTHQIRVQFSSRKMPLAGDRRYGGGSGDLALWSCHLSFPHPKTGKRLTFEQMPSGGIWNEWMQ